MTDDVVFMVPGREPFGKEAFAAAFEGMHGLRIEGTADIVELQGAGRLGVSAQPSQGDDHATRRLAHDALGLHPHHPAQGARTGRWRLARDANLLA